MDHLNESMAATSIDNCEGASAAANGTDATAIEPDLLMAVTKRKHNVNEDSESDDDNEGHISKYAAKPAKKGRKETKPYTFGSWRGNDARVIRKLDKVVDVTWHD